MINRKAIDDSIEASKNQFYEELAKLIAIKSVKGKAHQDAPFGSGPREALEAIVKIIEKFGFKARIVNNAMAYAQWGEDNQDYVGVVDHLDVVPVGENWHTDPWTLTKVGDKYYGRGILDNKGPAFATLWALKLLKDLGYQPKRTIRIIFGSDEESGSNDIPLYLESEKPPVFGWTADCKYPVVYGERGIVNYEIDMPIEDDSITDLGDFKGDMAKDHVPDDITVKIAGKKTHAKGLRSPSNAPEMGMNAITVLAEKVINDELVSGRLLEYFKWIDEKLANKHYGEGLGLDFNDQDSGKLIMTPTGISKSSDGIKLELAFRYPVSFSESQVTQGLQAQLPKNSTLKVTRSVPSVMHDKNSKYIKVLSEVYEEITGLDGTPVTTTGATYARRMPNIIAFGPSFPGQKGIAHKEDEWMSDQDLMMNIKIYISALMRLGDLD